MSGPARREDRTRCRDCDYGLPIYQGDDVLIMGCTYVLRTGRRRPCPPGEECSIFKEKERTSQ